MYTYSVFDYKSSDPDPGPPTKEAKKARLPPPPRSPPASNSNPKRMKKIPATEEQDAFSIKVLPPEMLYMIFERMDDQTLFNCMYVSEQWKYIALTVANADKERWKQIVEYSGLNYGDAFSLKSNHLEWKEIFINACRWHHVASASFDMHCTLKADPIKKIAVYRDHLAVMDSVGAKYYHPTDHTVRRDFRDSRSIEVLETDEMILLVSQDTENDVSIALYGKSSPDDLAYFMQDEDGQLIYCVKQYKVDRNSCYIINDKNVLTRYTWKKDNRWEVLKMGRYYGTKEDIPISINVWNNEVYVLFKYGQLYKCVTRGHFELVTRIQMPKEEIRVSVTLAHLFCVVFGVTRGEDFRITRYLDSNCGQMFYKFECPNLSCVTQHGEMLIFGYEDGKIEFFMPRAHGRKNMLKRRLHITELDKNLTEPEDLIIKSVDVFEDFQKQHLFIATTSQVHHAIVTNLDVDVWEKLPDIFPPPKKPSGLRPLL